MLDSARSKSTGVHWLRGEPRQCGDRAHRLIPPSMAPTGERRPSMACLRPIPAPPRLSPSGCPWLRRCWSKARWRQCLLQRAELLARRSGERHTAKDVAARGFRPSGTWMYRTRVLEQDAQPRGGRNPLAAAAPPEAKLWPLQRRPMPLQMGEEPKTPRRRLGRTGRVGAGGRGCGESASAGATDAHPRTGARPDVGFSAPASHHRPESPRR